MSGWILLFMSIGIRQLELERDREPVVEFLFRYLTPQSDDARFDWLYLANPAGKAQVWAAEDSKTSQMIGVSAVFPRLFYERGRETMGFVLGDFCVHPEYRSLGPAVMLQRASIEQMIPAMQRIGYDLPAASMLAVQRRLGMMPSDRLARLAKPLRTERKISSRIKVRSIAKGLSTVGNSILKLRDQMASSSTEEQVTMHRGSCEEEFTILTKAASRHFDTCVARTSTYLNWRYLSHPFARFEMLTVRRHGVLKGYLVMLQEGEDARIVDLFGSPDSALLTSLILKAVELMRERGVMTLSAPLLASHPGKQIFEKLGFQERDSCPVIFYPQDHGATSANQGTGPKWFLMDGDRDS
jgi:GNAT superfamily N-acetyltransferase